MTEDRIKGALAKVSTEGLPAVSVAGGKCVLKYDPAAYEKRISADTAAIAGMCSIVSSSVEETLAPHAAHELITTKVSAQTVTLVIRPLPEKK